MSEDNTVAVPTWQAKRFALALCQHLGIAPEVISDDGIQVRFGSAFADIHLHAVLPADQVEALFNAAAVREKITDE